MKSNKHPLQQTKNSRVSKHRSAQNLNIKSRGQHLPNMPLKASEAPRSRSHTESTITSAFTLSPTSEKSALSQRSDSTSYTIHMTSSYSGVASNIGPLTEEDLSPADHNFLKTLLEDDERDILQDHMSPGVSQHERTSWRTQPMGYWPTSVRGHGVSASAGQSELDGIKMRSRSSTLIKADQRALVPYRPAPPPPPEHSTRYSSTEEIQQLGLELSAGTSVAPSSVQKSTHSDEPVATMHTAESTGFLDPNARVLYRMSLRLGFRPSGQKRDPDAARVNRRLQSATPWWRNLVRQ